MCCPTRSSMVLKLLWVDLAVRSSIAEGKVLGINLAMLREFGGSNFTIPVRYRESLLIP